MQGRKTAAAAAKAELRPNRWFVRLGEHNDAGGASGESGGGGVSGPETRQLPPEMTAENLLKKARFGIAFVVKRKVYLSFSRHVCPKPTV